MKGGSQGMRIRRKRSITTGKSSPAEVGRKVCGWLKDKYGLSAVMEDMMQDKDLERLRASPKRFSK